jgi:acetyl-CoA carboxylase carboxyltransferase component
MPEFTKQTSYRNGNYSIIIVDKLDNFVAETHRHDIANIIIEGCERASKPVEAAKREGVDAVVNPQHQQGKIGDCTDIIMVLPCRHFNKQSSTCAGCQLRPC